MWGLSEQWWLGSATAIFSLIFLIALVTLQKGIRLPHYLTLGTLGFGFIIQTVGLYIRGLQVGACPLGNPFEILHFIAWSIILIYLVVGPVFQVRLLGFFTAGLVALLGLIAFLVPGWDEPRYAPLFGGDPVIELHASLAVFSYGAFGLLSLVAIMFLLQDFSLSHKSKTPAFRFLPPLNKLEHLIVRLLGVGLIMLSLALAVGVISWTRETTSVAGIKLLATSTVWLAYTITLILRWKHLLVARPFAWTCLILFVIALLVLWPVQQTRSSNPSGESLGNPPEQVEGLSPERKAEG